MVKPVETRFVRLGDVCKFTSGGTPSRAVDSYFQGDIPWITGADITGPVAYAARSYISPEALTKSAASVATEGTVLLVTRTSVGKVAVAGRDIAFSQDITAVQPHSEVACASYITHMLRVHQPTLERQARGATIQGVTRRDVESLKIPLPSLDEQWRIAAILDKADDLRTKRRQALAHLDTLTQEIFHSMFGSLGGARTPLGGVIDVRTGGTPSRADPSNYGGNISWVKTTEVRNEPILRTGEHLTDKGLQTSNCTIFPVNAVVIAMYGQGKTRGQVGLLQVPAATNQACAVLLPTHNVDPAFLFHQLRGMYTEIRALGRGGNQENLNLSLVKGIPITLPPLDLQQVFAVRVAAVERLKESHRKHLAILDALFASLQHRAFKGEL